MESREMAAAAAAAAAASSSRGGGGGARLPPPNPNLPYREDCWSEGETAALVGAWGSRYEDLNRGNLRQKQWKEVAEAVNTRRGAAARRRPPRTDVQCKNRVDTLKKKYKAERARGGPSGWSFYDELHRLVGPTLAACAAKARHAPVPPPLHFALPLHPASPARKRPASPSSSPSPTSSPLRMALPIQPDYRRGAPLPTAAIIQHARAAAAAASGSDASDDPAHNNNNNSPQHSPSRSLSSLSGARRRSETDAGAGELARAIEAFAEMYERVESAKQRHSLEIERDRIDFIKQLEVKRMENFVDAHLKLARATKRSRRSGAGAAANGGTSAAELVSSMTALPFLSNSTYL
ncbi:trihelix transcription factor ASIL2-like [Lolium rigidum]|uniref:trihelix transcription factor ASIL2-like n=1 Tax=Lolium rigidum TaxID=89674 RepID=UPI001F5D3AA8|nr:trihelix transcription factor ASIL2-like [Lolium rigidum]